MTSIAQQMAAASEDYMAGEAAVTVACYASGPDDGRLLLDILGLTGARYQWDTARVAFLILERCRDEFTACSLYLWVPERARRLIARAMQWLRIEGLIERTGRIVPSAAPGARGRRIPCWRLTSTGERLGRNLSPLPGMAAQLAELY